MRGMAPRSQIASQRSCHLPRTRSRFTIPRMTQDEMKRAVAAAAIAYVPVRLVPPVNEPLTLTVVKLSA